MSYVNLDCPPPDGLHRQRDEAGDRVRQGQVVDKVMDIGADPVVIRPSIITPRARHERGGFKRKQPKS